MTKLYKLDLTPSQLEMVLWQLNEGVIGDNDPYDNKLKKLIKKIESQAEEQDDKRKR